MGDRIPAIFHNGNLNGKGYLRIVSAVDKNANYAVDYKIDLKKWYHIEISQTKINRKVSELNNFSLLK